MTTSDRKRVASRHNATKSTGPKTAKGKAKASQNAVSHGILSQGLLLADEDAEEYESLLQSLMNDLRPYGALELIHVERIATAVWRQRRLIRAETAAVAFRQELGDTRKMLTESLGISTSTQFKDKHLEPMTEDDMRHLGSVGAIFEELCAIRTAPDVLEKLQPLAPVFYDYLEQMARQQSMSVHRYVALTTGLPEERMREAITKLIEQRKKTFADEYVTLEKRIKVTALSQRYQAMKVIPPEAELFARYQVALDNTLTKAIKALREAQMFRLSLVEQPAERDE